MCACMYVCVMESADDAFPACSYIAFGKMPFVMTFLANGRLARLTTRCLCFGTLLTQVSSITGTSVYVTQWDERSMHSIFQAVAYSSPDFLDVFAVFLAKTY